MNDENAPLRGITALIFRDALGIDISNRGISATVTEVRLVKTMAALPAHLRGSLTWDQGAEMAAHKSFTVATDMGVYFCDPASPWQRGSNENNNGLLAEQSHGHRPDRLRPRRPRARRPGTQRPPTQNARLGYPSRAPA